MTTSTRRIEASRRRPTDSPRTVRCVRRTLSRPPDNPIMPRRASLRLEAISAVELTPSSYRLQENRVPLRKFALTSRAPATANSESRSGSSELGHSSKPYVDQEQPSSFGLKASGLPGHSLKRISEPTLAQAGPIFAQASMNPEQRLTTPPSSHAALKEASHCKAPLRRPRAKRLVGDAALHQSPRQRPRLLSAEESTPLASQLPLTGGHEMVPVVELPAALAPQPAPARQLYVVPTSASWAHETISPSRWAAL